MKKRVLIDQQQADWDAKLYGKIISTTPFNQTDPLAQLSIQPDEKILDFGCGTGELTRKIALQGGRVVGIDPSAEMIAVAREQFSDIEFYNCDVREFNSSEKFDKIFSNDVLHWIKQPQPTLKKLYDLLRDNGKFVAEFAGQGNISKIQQLLHKLLEEYGYDPQELDPWYFPSIEQYKTELEKAGFKVLSIDNFKKTAELPGAEGFRLWMSLFSNKILSPLEDNQRRSLINRLEASLKSTHFKNNRWYLDYRRIKFIAEKTTRPPRIVKVSSNPSET